MVPVCATAEDKELQRLLEKIYRERGCDFRGYKKPTLTRRIARRLHASGAATYADYGAVLERYPAEYDRLLDDLTIKVTGFLRDEAAFRALEEQVLPKLLGHRDFSVPHIWSAGCATGEEPYSIAMLLLETAGRKLKAKDVAILATDIDGKALEFAREGLYTPKGTEGVRPGWRKKYFSPADKGFRVRPAVKDLVIFAAHNLVSDPPHQDLALVVCRNVLIYFTPPLQAQVLKGFHQGLKRGGFLLLGRAETPGAGATGLFRCLNREARLYRKEG